VIGVAARDILPGSPWCSFCSRPAVILERERNVRLCDDHLVTDLEGRVRTYMLGKRIVSPGDHIAVALSGGKDSSALLLVLHRLKATLPGITLTAVTVDEGIAGYREETIDAASELAAGLGVPHHTISFAGLFDEDLDSILRRSQGRPCTVCGVLRRRAMEIAAMDVGATKIATGHNLDDEAQSVLMNVLRGDKDRFVQDSALGDSAGFIPRIKPLSTVTEKEVVTYLLVRGFFRDLPECPYASGALRHEIKGILTDLEFKWPGTHRALIRSRDSIRTIAAQDDSTGRCGPCRMCGEPSRGEVCRVCALLSYQKT
jgi:uncharacterized protein (TIGR00269 family)